MAVIDWCLDFVPDSSLYCCSVVNFCLDYNSKNSFPAQLEFSEWLLCVGVDSCTNATLVLHNHTEALLL